MPPALLALAPVVAKGAQTFIQHKQASNAAKDKIAYDKAQATADAAAAKSKWEAESNSPQAAGARFKNTFALGKLAGHVGGMDKVPKSIAAFYNAQRAMPTYVEGPGYVEPPKPRGGGWNIAAGITDALSQYSPSSFGGAKSALGGVANAGGAFKTGQIAQLGQQLFKPKVPGFGSGTQDFG